MVIDWDEDKNTWLKENRGVCFEDVVNALSDERLLDDIIHPNEKYRHQRIFVLEINEYVHAVPYVGTDEGIFLKTMYPDRRLNQKYLS